MLEVSIFKGSSEVGSFGLQGLGVLFNTLLANFPVVEGLRLCLCVVFRA